MYGLHYSCLIITDRTKTVLSLLPCQRGFGRDLCYYYYYCVHIRAYYFTYAMTCKSMYESLERGGGRQTAIVMEIASGNDCNNGGWGFIVQI